MIVLDASAAVCLILDSPRDRANRIRGRLPGEQLHSPYLIDLEVANTLRRLVQAGDLTAARALEALDDFAHLPLSRHPHLPFLMDIWRLRDNYTAYDAVYLTLAVVLDVLLITLLHAWRVHLPVPESRCFDLSWTSKPQSTSCGWQLV